MSDDRDMGKANELPTDADRDLGVADAINALSVPPRDGAFMSDLLARLEQADADRAGLVGVSPSARRQPRRPKRIVLVAAAALLLAAAATAALALLPGHSNPSGSTSLGPADASAAQVAAWMTKGLSAATSIEEQADLRVDTPLMHRDRTSHLPDHDKRRPSHGDRGTQEHLPAQLHSTVRRRLRRPTVTSTARSTRRPMAGSPASWCTTPISTHPTLRFSTRGGTSSSGSTSSVRLPPSCTAHCRQAHPTFDLILSRTVAGPPGWWSSARHGRAT